MRCFIAVDMGNHLVNSFMDELSEIGAGLKIVKPENLHLTLKFLGEVGDEKIDSVRKAMDESLEDFGPFEVSMHGTGAFPSQNYMRVVWIGMQENREHLIEMQEGIDGKLAGLGFPEEKRFHPHLTLARVKSQKGKGRLKAFISKNKERPFGVSKVESVELKKSVLAPGGPVYSTIGEVKLAGV